MVQRKSRGIPESDPAGETFQGEEAGEDGNQVHCQGNTENGKGKEKNQADGSTAGIFLTGEKISHCRVLS